MRDEKGVTLISLITYVIVLLIAISAITLITNFFINNMNEVENDSKGISEINKFDLLFLSDIKQENVSIYKTDQNGSYIIFEKADGTDIQYIYQDNKIYRIENGSNKIKVNDEIENFYISTQNEKIEVIIEVEGYKTTKHYKLGKY